MIAVAFEVAALVGLACTGWLLVPPDHGTPWRVAAALPLGAAAQAVATTILLAVPLPIAHPWAGLAVALLAAAGAAAGRSRRADAVADTDGAASSSRARWWLAGAAVVAVATVALTATWPLVNLTADSFRYITTAQLLVADASPAAMSPFLLQSRMLGTSAVHGLSLPALGYLRAFGPLLAISGLALVHLVVRSGLRSLDPSQAGWVAAAAAAVLATTHRWIFSAMYINGHVQFAVWLLLLVAIIWRVLRAAAAGAAAGRATTADALAAVVLIGGITVLRPEGALVVLIALVPVMVEPRVPGQWRRWLLLGAGAANLLWHLGVLVPVTRGAGGELPLSVLGMVALGVGTLLLAVRPRVVDGRFGRNPLAWLHGLAWAALAVLTARNPELFVESAKATVRNVWQSGGWGATLLLLAALLVVAVVQRRTVAEQAWLFPLLTFVPFGLLLAVLRDGAYRIGPGDSLNRMLLHVLPLAVVALALAADGTPRAVLGASWSLRRVRDTS